eukprot:8963528-Lingulodinium_polyedra.AAC.1
MGSYLMLQSNTPAGPPRPMLRRKARRAWTARSHTGHCQGPVKEVPTAQHAPGPLAPHPFERFLL